MESNKSRGSDGLPAEFYSFLERHPSHQHLQKALNCAYTKSLLSITQRRGLIVNSRIKIEQTCQLLNCDFKIATKIRKVLPKIVNNDKTGFLKGRFIGAENIRLREDPSTRADHPSAICFLYSFHAKSCTWP